YLANKNFSHIGIPVFTNSALFSFYTVRLCREILPNSTIIFGNIHATSCYERTLQECPEVDYIVLGEGEYTILELVQNGDREDPDTVSHIEGLAFRDKDNKIVCNPKRTLIGNLDELPSIADVDINLSRYKPAPNQIRKLPAVPYITSRGCPFRCSFCEVNVIHGRKVRRVSVDKVINDLTKLREVHNISSVYFLDSTFTLDREYIFELCKQMVAEKLNIEWFCSTRTDQVDEELLRWMKRAGCWTIAYGIESANKASLAILQKGGRVTPELQMRVAQLTRSIGIRVLASFIICLPGENELMVENTIKYAKEMNPHTALFFLPVPYPGSELYRTCLEDGGIREDYVWEDFLSIDYDNPVYVNPLLGKNLMRYYYRKAYRDFYLSPRVWLNNLATIKDQHDVKRYLRGAAAMLGFFYSWKDNILKI
ncbi:MAG: B12-binding domain-containing radical SAM protein, partial [Planctomycetota bacterium]